MDYMAGKSPFTIGSNMFRELRDYVPTDREQIMNLDKLALSEVGAEGLPASFNDLEDVESTYMANGTFVVQEHDGLIVGMGGMRYLDSDTAKISRMRVHPDYQRKGIARLILNWLELKASDASISTIILNTLAIQEKAQKLYESHGYLKVSEGAPDGFDVFMYEKTIRDET